MIILVLGRIWEPDADLCSYCYQPGASLLQPPCSLPLLGGKIPTDKHAAGFPEENPSKSPSEEEARAVVQAWLNKNAGDFQSIQDFTVLNDIHNRRTLLPWKDPKSSYAYAAACEP